MSKIRTVKSYVRIRPIFFMFLIFAFTFKNFISSWNSLVVQRKSSPVPTINRSLRFDLNPLVGSGSIFQQKFPSNIITRVFTDPRLKVITALSLSGRGGTPRFKAECLDHQQKKLSEVSCVLHEKYSIRCSCDVSRTKFLRIFENPALSNVFPVERLPDYLPESRKGTLALCIAPIFGKQSQWLLLLQNIEWNKLVGMEKIFVYFLESNDNATKTVLEYYVFYEPMIELVPIPRGSSCSLSHACRHDFQLQDCMFRTMHKFAYVAAHDIDEFLVPLKHKTLPDLIREVDAPEWGSFSFQNRWILRFLPEPPGTNLFQTSLDKLSDLINKSIPVNRWTNGTSLAPVGHTPKAIFKPETPRYMGVHHVHTWHFPGRHKEFLIPPDTGYVRHFRYMPTFSKYREAASFGPHSITQVPHRLLRKLLAAVKCTAGKIRGKYTYHCLQ